MDHKKSLTQVLGESGLSLDVNPNGTDKEFPKLYLSHVYQPCLDLRVGPVERLLEIGVRTGASLKLWREFFPGTLIIGIDNEVDVRWQNQQWIEGERVEYLIADAYTDEVFKILPNKIDVIIDDGPHWLDTQIWAAKNYIKLLPMDGMLFIEDIQGGKRNYDQIIRSLPKTFTGCVRIFDLTKASKQGDSIIVMLHNCPSSCALSKLARNELTFIPTVFRLLHLSLIKYKVIRGYKKVYFKLKSLKATTA